MGHYQLPHKTTQNGLGNTFINNNINKQQQQPSSTGGIHCNISDNYRDGNRCSMDDGDEVVADQMN
jgi:hypothetical protein